MQIPKVRRILHFKSQRAQYQGIQNSTITNFFTILLLQCNSKGRIVLQHNSKTYNIFLFTFSDSLSLSLSLSLYALVCFSSHSSLHNSVSLSSHLSLTVGYSGVGRGFGVEVRLGSQIGVVWWRFLGFFGYVFWVHGYAAALYGGLQRRVHGFPVWFAAARLVCSWVCVNFDLIFFCGSSFGFKICQV